MASAFSSYSKDELLKKLKKQKTMAIVQGLVIFLMIVFAVFTTLENGVSFQTFLPLFFAPMLAVMFFEIKKIKKEIASRIEYE
tara:strand:- start:56 stop:304 length:249 start_codon:yes stop_codon:yes gene_type:complete